MKTKEAVEKIRHQIKQCRKNKHDFIPVDIITAEQLLKLIDEVPYYWHELVDEGIPCTGQ